jgi:hypothetical protein
MAGKKGSNPGYRKPWPEVCKHNFGGYVEDFRITAGDARYNKPEKSGGAVSYYLVNVTKPNQGNEPYQAECTDIIEALGMTFAEGEAFKAIWRTAAARTLGRLKDGGSATYDAKKVVFFGKRMLAAEQTPAEYVEAKRTVVTHAPPLKRNGNDDPFNGIEKDSMGKTHWYVEGIEVPWATFEEFQGQLDASDIRKYGDSSHG